MSLLDSKKILLVEDESLVTDMYQNFLERNGASVTIAENGEKGLEAMQKESFDLVILDRILNDDLSGFDVLEKMREDEKTKDISVIILSNLNLEEGEKEFVEKHKIGGYYLKAEVSLDTFAEILSKVAG